MKHLRLTGALAIAIIGVGTISVALSAASSGSATTHAKAVHASHAAKAGQAATREAQPSTDADNVQQGDQTNPDSGPAVSLVKPRVATAADGDNVQQGDQTSPDTGQATTRESTGEAPVSESAPSDGPGGYADTTANADTQQQGQH